MKIKSVTYIVDEQDYYDITVEGTHNFLLADGSIVHNCGTGLGFSVERKEVNQLPTIPETINDTNRIIVVRDSKAGWASGFRELIECLYSGESPEWDFSRIRPAGARLKTFGGRASGPEPLGDLFRFTRHLFKNAVGRKLTSLEVHDLVCKIAQIVVVGGVRRSALISLSDLSDEHMRGAKNGAWYDLEKQRALANNSVAYKGKPDIGTFMKEWTSLYESRSGERGIFNRDSMKAQAIKSGRRNPDYDFLTNPCAEIGLRSAGLCNLTEIIVRPDDNFRSLKDKVEIATIMGTYQSMLTEFRYVRKIWQKNAEEERLLGVSMTGIMDHEILGTTSKETAEILSQLKEIAIETNRKYAGILGIPVSAAITTVKPSGTVSQLVDSASGIHLRHAPFYIRTVRNDIKDPLSQFLIDQGVPHELDKFNANAYVFSFPMKAPEGALFRNDRSAIQQLEHYLMYKDSWTEHNVSITVYVKEHEWLTVGAWVYEHFDKICGVSFLPHSDHVYEQAPYQDITEEQYTNLSTSFPKLDWPQLAAYEGGIDNTTGSQELACTGGQCELF